MNDLKSLLLNILAQLLIDFVRAERADLATRRAPVLDALDKSVQLQQAGEHWKTVAIMNASLSVLSCAGLFVVLHDSHHSTLYACLGVVFFFTMFGSAIYTMFLWTSKKALLVHSYMHWMNHRVS